MKSYDDKRYSGMLDTSYGAPQSPIRLVGDGDWADKHPNGPPSRARFRAPRTQEIHRKSNIFHVFELRYLCDYWELQAETKTGERFRNSFCICISIRLDLLSWIVNQTGLSQGWRQLLNTDYDWLRHNLWFLCNNTEIEAQKRNRSLWLRMLLHVLIMLLV